MKRMKIFQAVRVRMLRKSKSFFEIPKTGVLYPDLNCGVPNCMVIDSREDEVKKRLVNAFSGGLIRFYYGKYFKKKIFPLEIFSFC